MPPRKGLARRGPQLAPFDVEQARKAIAHPTPEDWVSAPAEVPRPAPARTTSRPNTSVRMACAECHDGPEMGYQFSRWRMSPHADAYAVLGRRRAAEIAAEQWRHRARPQTDPGCLKCHATARITTRPAGSATEGLVYEGVGCEACHGAGSEYCLPRRMREPSAAACPGLKEVTRDTCAGLSRGRTRQAVRLRAGAGKRSPIPTRLPTRRRK